MNCVFLYLALQYKKHNLGDGISNDVKILNKFSWRGGKDRDTVGIWMWSEVFTHEYEDGRKVAVVLLDTQGIFDNESDLKECISIFAISMLLSSVQCYNVMRQVQEDDLTNLELFTEYARFAMENTDESTDEKPFQRLLFIVRDWPSPYDHEFGLCEKYANEDILSEKPRQTVEMRKLRDAIKNSFDKIDAFLLPYPGKDVAQQQPQNKKRIKLDPDFEKYVGKLVDNLLAPKNLITKKIGEKTVQSAEFLEYLATYVELFSGAELPKPISILQVYLFLL